MAVNKRSLENLKAGKPFKQGEERARICGKKGKPKSDEAKAKKKTMSQIAEICLNAKLTKPEIVAKLKEEGLPATYGGQMIFNAIQMAGKNSNMLRVVLELIGEVKQAQTNVNVTTNVNPYANLTEDELRKLAKED